MKNKTKGLPMNENKKLTIDEFANMMAECKGLELEILLSVINSFIMNGNFSKKEFTTRFQFSKQDWDI